jgi:hypothetical protein
MSRGWVSSASEDDGGRFTFENRVNKLQADSPICSGYHETLSAKESSTHAEYHLLNTRGPRVSLWGISSGPADEDDNTIEYGRPEKSGRRAMARGLTMERLSDDYILLVNKGNDLLG